MKDQSQGLHKGMNTFYRIDDRVEKENALMVEQDEKQAQTWFEQPKNLHTKFKYL